MGSWAHQRAEAADRLCDHRGAEGHLVRSLGELGAYVCMYLDAMGHVRYATEGSCWGHRHGHWGSEFRGGEV